MLPKGAGQGIFKGLLVTMRGLLRHTITVQYPEKRLSNSRRIRGCELIWDKERCTVCLSCAKSCPQGNIRIVSRRRPDNTYEAVDFEVDHGRCMFCGLCVECCPFEALHLGRGYERANYRRGKLVLNKEELVASEGRRPSGYFRPGFEAGLPPQDLLIYGSKGSKPGPEKS